ncbi:MAG: triphosphoribosyl-dephospho-CoA synthase [Gallionellaceae bacterium]|nr:triphosphoribosyl-dephospho-CoA synthase [Gallionellaceae bacterium]
MNARLAPPIPACPMAPAAAFIEACALDVSAFKPGNVSHDSPGHGMTADDFLLSAAAAAPPLADPALGVGERIYRAIEATHRAVACNTNLGIVLLAAPLIHAAQNRRPGETLAGRLHHTLAGLDREDAEWAYRAICLAAPAGLGTSPRHDVRTRPAVSLLTAMAEAAQRDRIACQYANGYADIFASGLPALRRERIRLGSDERAGVLVYLGYLAEFPDSHVARKHGLATAERVQGMARSCLDELSRCPDWRSVRTRIEALDQAFKSAAINPGTSADLTVATWLADRLGHAGRDMNSNQARNEKRDV